MQRDASKVEAGPAGGMTRTPGGVARAAPVRDGSSCRAGMRSSKRTRADRAIRALS